MATQKLEIKSTLVNAVQYGMQNVLPLLLTVVFYVVTLWIPYLNVGTTIGLYKAIMKIGRGEVINPLDIFAKENRENLGDFFLLLGFVSMGTTVAAMFMIVPAIVLSIAWQFAIYFFIDRGIGPHKALKLSYKVTYGEKWTIFFIFFIVFFVICLICGLLGAIPKVGEILAVIAYICSAVIVVAVEGVMFKHFSDKADEMIAEGCGCGCGCKAPEAPAAPEAPEAPAAPEAPSAPEAPDAPEAPAE